MDEFQKYETIMASEEVLPWLNLSLLPTRVQKISKKEKTTKIFLKL